MKKVLKESTTILKLPRQKGYGSANSWLMSDIFRLGRPYSTGAEQALEDTKIKRRV